VVNTMAIGVMPTASPARLLENPRTSSRYINTKANNMEDPIMLMTVAMKNRFSAGLNERNPGCDIGAHTTTPFRAFGGNSAMSGQNPSVECSTTVLGFAVLFVRNTDG
jgi:hypothetical protein